MNYNGNKRHGNYDSRANRVAAGILVILISLLAFLSLVNAIGGVGRMISGFLVGVFGYASYAYSICGLFLGCMIVLGRRVTLPAGKAVKYILLFSVALLVFQVYFSRNMYFGRNYGGYLGALYRGESAAGLLGGIFSFPIMKIFTPAYGMVVLIVLFAGLSVLSFYPLLAKSLPYRTKKTKIKGKKNGGEDFDFSDAEMDKESVPVEVGNSLYIGTLDEGDKPRRAKKGRGFSMFYPNGESELEEDTISPVIDSDEERRRRAKEKLYGGTKKEAATEELTREEEVKPSLKNGISSFTFDSRLRDSEERRPKNLKEAFNLPEDEEAQVQDMRERFGYILDTPTTAKDIRGAATKRIAEPKRKKEPEPMPEPEKAPEQSEAKSDYPTDMPYFIREILEGGRDNNKKKAEEAPSAPAPKDEEEVKPSIMERPAPPVINSIAKNEEVKPAPSATPADDDDMGSIFTVLGGRPPKPKAEPVPQPMPSVEEKVDVDARLADDYTEKKETNPQAKTDEHVRLGYFEDEGKAEVVMPTDAEIKAATEPVRPVVEKPRQPYAPREREVKDEKKEAPSSYNNDFNIGGKAKTVNVSTPEKKVPAQQISIDQAIMMEQQRKPYMAPPIDLLEKRDDKIAPEDFTERIAQLEKVFSDFHIDAKVVGVTQGPTFSRFELQMPPGISVSKVSSYADDIAMKLRVKGGVRFETPIPGKDAFGVEIANNVRTPVGLRGILESEEFNSAESQLAFGLGRDIGNNSIVCDLDSMPHMLIAGGTGSGKSVCINSLLISLLYRCGPSDLKLILIDPKMVEMTPYNGIPHLLVPEAIDDVKAAVNALDWAINEMNNRYKMFKGRFKNINDYNSYAEVTDGVVKLPRIVIVFDELADFMAKNKRDIEDKINALTRLARAAGIHVVVSTQRPSVDVITGTIKSNLPSRIALSLKTTGDSMTILGGGGAEKLLGNGDMLYLPTSLNEPMRLQGAFVSGNEVFNIVEYIKSHNEAYFDPEAHNAIFKVPQEEEEDEEKDMSQSYASRVVGRNGETKQFIDALYLCVKEKKASISRIQRKFHVGYGSAANIVDLMYEKGYISENKGGNSQRDVLLSVEQFKQLYGDYVEEQQEDYSDNAED